MPIVSIQNGGESRKEPQLNNSSLKLPQTTSTDNLGSIVRNSQEANLTDNFLKNLQDLPKPGQETTEAQKHTREILDAVAQSNNKNNIGSPTLKSSTNSNELKLKDLPKPGQETTEAQKETRKILDAVKQSTFTSGRH